MKRICFVLPAVVFLGCFHNPQALEEPFLFMQSFIEIYERYEADCPYFAHKGIDWTELAADYYPVADQCETEEEFIAVVTDMLAELHDPAIYLRKYDEYGEILETVHPHSQEYYANYDMDVIVEQYLEPNGWAGWESGYCGGFGWCDPSVLPYAFMDTIPDGYFSPAVDSLDSFVEDCIQLNVPAVILDLRMNPFDDGPRYDCGDDLMGRFTIKSRPGAIYRARSGPEYDQYWDIRPSVYPAGASQYAGTVIVLVGENCINQSENMLANFINFPNVVLVGDTTGGSVSDVSSTTLLEGWECDIVIETILTFDKFWIEGAGLPPDYYVEATEADFAAGVDPVLDFAIEMLDKQAADR